MKGLKMSELANACISLVRAAGGKLAYRELYTQTAPEMRPRLPSALREARGEGVLDQSVEMVDGAVVHSYFLVGR